MKLDRVMIAAPKSGSGKTTITCAILQTLKDMENKWSLISAARIISIRCSIKES